MVHIHRKENTQCVNREINRNKQPKTKAKPRCTWQGNKRVGWNKMKYHLYWDTPPLYTAALSLRFQSAVNSKGPPRREGCKLQHYPHGCSGKEHSLHSEITECPGSCETILGNKTVTETVTCICWQIPVHKDVAVRAALAVQHLKYTERRSQTSAMTVLSL